MLFGLAAGFRLMLYSSGRAFQTACKIRCLGCEDAEADYGKGLLLQPHRFISHRFSRLSLRHFTRVSLPKVLVARVEIFLRHEKCEARQPRITSQSWYGTMQLAAS